MWYDALINLLFAVVGAGIALLTIWLNSRDDD